MHIPNNAQTLLGDVLKLIERVCKLDQTTFFHWDAQREWGIFELPEANRLLQEELKILVSRWCAVDQLVENMHGGANVLR